MNSEIKAILTKFVETGKIDESYALKLNSNKVWQDFVEQKMAKKFEPLQRLFQKLK